MKKLFLLVLLAAVLWTVMFFPGISPLPNFWAMMTVSSALLAGLGTFFDSSWIGNIRLNWQNCFLGLGIAIALWLVFFAGDRISGLLFNFARPQINLIYGMKGGQSAWTLSLLLLFVIGPCEEIFWRGYVQDRLSRQFSPNAGWLLAAALYTLIHVGSCNFMLVMAALVAGIAWGTLYRYFPQYFSAIILSHSLWDAAVFVWFPI